MRFGYATSSLLRANPPPSKWFVAPGPLRRNSHCAPMNGRRHFSVADGCIETGWRLLYWM